MKHVVQPLAGMCDAGTRRSDYALTPIDTPIADATQPRHNSRSGRAQNSGVHTYLYAQLLLGVNAEIALYTLGQTQSRLRYKARYLTLTLRVGGALAIIL